MMVSFLVISPKPALALILNFTDGVAEFTDFSTGGALFIKRITNTSGFTKTDVHLTISYLDDNGNPDPVLNRVYEQVFESPLANSGTYNVNPPIGTVIYANNAILNQGYTPDADNVRLSGYLTPVPAPLPILGVGVVFSAFRRLKKQTKQLKSLAAPAVV